MNNRKLLLMVCCIVLSCSLRIGSVLAEQSTMTIGEGEQAGKSVLAGGVIEQNDGGRSPATDDTIGEDQSADEIADPLYLFNRAAFHFNDEVYRWLLDPAAKGYKYVTPELVRVGFGNAFNNLRAPVNIVNNLLQLQVGRSGLELFRFVFNSVVGIGGFYDASYHLLDIDKNEADFAQTMGYYGIGHGIYVVWPLIGPSSLRETVGFAGNQMMSPLTYIGYFALDIPQSVGIVSLQKMNDESFMTGNYEMLIGNAPDPYEAMKNAFIQYRKRKTKQTHER